MNNIEAIADYAVDNARLQIMQAISTIEVWGQELSKPTTARHLIDRIFEEKDLESDIEADKIDKANEVKSEMDILREEVDEVSTYY